MIYRRYTVLIQDTTSRTYRRRNDIFLRGQVIGTAYSYHRTYGSERSAKG